MIRITIALACLFAFAGGAATTSGSANAATVLLCLGNLDTKSLTFDLTNGGDCSPIISVGYSISTDTGETSGTKLASNAKFSDVTVVKNVDLFFSPWFLSAAINGGRYDQITIGIGDFSSDKLLENEVRFEIRLFDVFVSSISTSATTDETPVEAVTLAFQRQEVIFPGQ